MKNASAPAPRSLQESLLAEHVDGKPLMRLERLVDAVRAAARLAARREMGAGAPPEGRSRATARRPRSAGKRDAQVSCGPMLPASGAAERPSDRRPRVWSRGEGPAGHGLQRLHGSLGEPGRFTIRDRAAAPHHAAGEGGHGRGRKACGPHHARPCPAPRGRRLTGGGRRHVRGVRPVPPVVRMSRWPASASCVRRAVEPISSSAYTTTSGSGPTQPAALQLHDQRRAGRVLALARRRAGGAA